jgi:hypothetical protein
MPDSLYVLCDVCRAWVGGTNIKLFDLEHLVSKKGNGLFSLKQFSSSAGYRFAVMEAVRIALVGLRGRKIEDKALIDAVVNLMRKYEPVSRSESKVRELCDSKLFDDLLDLLP